MAAGTGTLRLVPEGGSGPAPLTGAAVALAPGVGTRAANAVDVTIRAARAPACSAPRA